MTTPSATTERTYHHGDLRNALIKAGVEIMIAEGIEALTLRKVADHVGVSRTAPYRHFESKDALVSLITQQSFQQLGETIIHAKQAAGDISLDRFYAGGLAYAQFAVQCRSRYFLMFGNNLDRTEHPELVHTGLETFKILVDSMIELQADGTLKTADPVEQAFVIWSSLHGVVHLYLDDKLIMFENLNFEGRIRMVLDNLLNGLVNSPEQTH